MAGIRGGPERLQGRGPVSHRGSALPRPHAQPAPPSWGKPDPWAEIPAEWGTLLAEAPTRGADLGQVEKVGFG